jgi:hypothetical protein
MDVGKRIKGMRGQGWEKWGFIIGFEGVSKAARCSALANGYGVNMYQK